jgi:hypothetical protein
MRPSCSCMEAVTNPAHGSISPTTSGGWFLGSSRSGIWHWRRHPDDRDDRDDDRTRRQPRSTVVAGIARPPRRTQPRRCRGPLLARCARGERRADAIASLGVPHGCNAMDSPDRHTASSTRHSAGTAHTGRANDYRRWTTIGGSLDVVVPASFSHLQTSQRIDLPGIGHAGLLTSPSAGGVLCAALLEASTNARSRPSTRRRVQVHASDEWKPAVRDSALLSRER